MEDYWARQPSEKMTEKESTDPLEWERKQEWAIKKHQWNLALGKIKEFCLKKIQPLIEHLQDPEKLRWADDFDKKKTR